ncbi:cyclic pyranopterin monophosphate synthase MoaC [candidate division KSB1 bacterium]
MADSLSHLDDRGRARMVDIGNKDSTRRTARACCDVRMSAGTLDLIMENKLPKGDVLAAARLAGIHAAKKTPDLIPLCHVLTLDSVSIDIEADRETSLLRLESTVTCTGKTGVEMEALTAVAVAALTIYDMCKSADRSMEITALSLVYKSGGKSGVYEKK